MNKTHREKEKEKIMPFYHGFVMKHFSYVASYVDQDPATDFDTTIIATHTKHQPDVEHHSLNLHPAYVCVCVSSKPDELTDFENENFSRIFVIQKNT